MTPPNMPRPDLVDLTPEQIAPLEVLINAWPASWQDFARSHYLTLLGLSADRSAARLAEAARLASELAMGIAWDMSGAQPYINAGAQLRADERALRVVQAWRAGQPWAAIAAAERITPRRAQQIVAAWQIEHFGRTQQSLHFED